MNNIDHITDLYSAIVKKIVDEYPFLSVRETYDKLQKNYPLMTYDEYFDELYPIFYEMHTITRKLNEKRLMC